MKMPRTNTVTEDQATEREHRLDDALDATFPASDPVAMSLPSVPDPAEGEKPVAIARQKPV